MAVDLDFWVDVMRRHPVKWRFQGLDGFHATVGEAAINDRWFLDDYASKEYSSWYDMLEKAKDKKSDADELLSRFVECISNRVSAREWREAFPDVDACNPWHKLPVELLLEIIDEFGDKYESDYINNWCMGDYEMISEDVKNNGGLLNEYPPVEMLDHASGCGVPIEDIFFICPSCGRHPVALEDMNRVGDMPTGFYCGMCGAEAILDKDEDFVDWMNNLDVKPYPFNPEKAAVWQARMDAKNAEV